jgi:hypothetical protein
MTSLFLLNVVAKLFQKLAAKKSTESYGEMKAGYCCNLADSVTGNYAYDKYKTLSEQFNHKGLPVNHDIEKATEKALLLAAREAVKFCRRMPQVTGEADSKKLDTIEAYLHTAVKEIDNNQHTHQTNNPTATDLIYLKLVGGEELPPVEQIIALEDRLKIYLIDKKLTYALHVFYSTADTTLPHN